MTYIVERTTHFTQMTDFAIKVSSHASWEFFKKYHDYRASGIDRTDIRTVDIEGVEDTYETWAQSEGKGEDETLYVYRGREQE